MRFSYPPTPSPGDRKTLLETQAGSEPRAPAMRGLYFRPCRSLQARLSSGALQQESPGGQWRSRGWGIHCL